MPDWINNNHAGFVLAAYAVAAAALMGVGVASFCAWRRRTAEWRLIKDDAP